MVIGNWKLEFRGENKSFLDISRHSVLIDYLRLLGEIFRLMGAFNQIEIKTELRKLV